MNIRKYQARPDGSIEYMNREWFIEQLVDKYYFEAAGTFIEKQAKALTEAHKTRLQTMTDEQLAQEYDANIGDPRME